MDGADPQLAFGSQQFNSMTMSHKLLVTLEEGQQLTSDGLYSITRKDRRRDKAMALRNLKPAAKRKENEINFKAIIRFFSDTCIM